MNHIASLHLEHARKYCNLCGKQKPIGEFTRRYRGQEARLPSCRECRAQRQREYRAAKRTRQLHLFSQQVRWERDATRLSRLVAQMVGRFGGTSNFARLWCEHALSAPPGSKQRGNVLLAVLALCRVIEPRKKSFCELSVEQQIDFDSERHPAEM